MTTYPLDSLSAVVTDAGITAPPYSDILLSLQASFRLIYGADTYLEDDCQDGQWLAVMAKAISDSNAAAIAVYNSFSPATAAGVGLSNNVKLNGLRRQSATYSTADLTITGDAGTTINNGIASDTLGQQWLLPSVVTITGGSVIVTATAANIGAIRADANTITTRATPTKGWAGVNNVAAATVGVAVELDGTLRQRQAASTGNAAQTPLEAITGVVAGLPGVTRVKPYENDTATTDGNGIPSHSISLIVEGGDATAIANAIALKKNPGTGTYGTTSILVTDANGVPNTINFFRPTIKRITGTIHRAELAGYVTSTDDAIKANVAAYGNGLDIGMDVYLSKIEAKTELPDETISATYNVTSVLIAEYPNSQTAADITLAFNEAASVDVADLTVTT